MKNFINKFKWFILGGIVFLTPTIYAVSQPSFTPSLVPLTDGIYNLGTTSPSNLRWNKLFLNNLYLYGISDGCLYTSSNLVTSTGAACGSGGGGGSNSFAWPFDVFTNYVSTSSKPVGFLNGLFSTASSTFSSNLYLSNLSQGLLFNGSFGLTKTVATTTLAGTGLISVSNSPVVIGASGAVISCSTCVADSRSVSAGTGLTGGGDLSGDRTISLTIPVVVSSGGTNATAFAGNSIITSNSAGTGLIATTSQLTVGSLIATSSDPSFFTGKLGIGTTTPNWPLQLLSGTQPQLVLTDPNAASGIKHVVLRSASGYLYLDKAADTFATTSLGPKITFDTNGNGSGKIGIGTTTPTQSISIQGPIGGGSSVGVNLFSDSTDGGKKVGSYTQELSLGNRFGQLALWSEDTQGLKLTGNILQRSYILPLAFGVGTDTPASRLSVWGAATDANIFEVVNVASTTFLKVSNTGFGTTTVSGLTISGSATSTSNVGFNITAGCYAISNTCIGSGSGSGTVTSVGLSLPSAFTVTNSPVTTSGTLTAALNLSPNSILTSDSAGTNIIATTSNLTVSSINATSTTGWSIFQNDGIMFGTSTPAISPYLTIFGTSTTAQMALSAGAGIPMWTFRNAGGNLYFSTTTAQGLSTTSTAAMTLNGTGYGFSVGSSSPNATVTIESRAGNANYEFFIGSTTALLTLDNSGHLFLPKLLVDAAAHTYTLCGEATTFEIRLDTTTCVLSAKKFKMNIADLDLGLKELLKVRPVVFNYKPTGDVQYDNNINIKHQQIGVIADEVEKIDSRLVTYDNRGEIKGFNYEQFTAWITNSIKQFYKEFQSLVARVAGLENKLNNQQKQIDSLTERLNKLEQK